MDLDQSSEKTAVIIEARDLDTDERGRTVLEVGIPADPSEERTALTAAVAERFPAAQLRSFADGAATFLDRQHLIVACFPKPNGQTARREQRASLATQEALFAA